MRKLIFAVLVAVVLPTLALAQVTTTPAPGMGTPLVNPTLRIDEDGTILVRNLIVTEMLPGMIRATFTYGSFQMPMVIQTSTTTVFWNRDASRLLSESDLAVGDTLSFSGLIRLLDGSPSVMAYVVRDWTPAAGNRSIAPAPLPTTPTTTPGAGVGTTSDNVATSTPGLDGTIQTGTSTGGGINY